MFARIGCHKTTTDRSGSSERRLSVCGAALGSAWSQPQERVGFLGNRPPAKQSRLRRHHVKWLGVWAFVALNLGNVSAAAAHDLAFEFATAAQAREIVGRNDDFIAQMSPFDRAARLKTDRNVSQDEYLSFLKSQVSDWSPSDKAAFMPILDATRSLVARFQLRWPDKIYLVKFEDKEHADTHYTRGKAILFPQSDLMTELPLKQPEFFSAIVAHELFHILSRYNPELRETLYAAIGFIPCGEVELPSDLAETQISNPDEPKTDYCIRVQIDGSDALVMPFLHSKFGKYDVKRGGDLFDYLELSFLRVPLSDMRASTAQNPPKFQFEPIDRLKGFYKQVGRNSMNREQLEQPDEILADNFSMLVRGVTNVPSPEVQNRIKAVLEDAHRK